jgi:hypothetical protein
MSDQLADVGGPTVPDTTIRYAGDAVSLGGLTIASPAFGDHYDRGTNITVPPSWPSLAVVQLVHRYATSAATFGLAVFKQTTLVTRPESRAVLVDHAFRIARHHESSVVRQSLRTDTASGVTCWTELRHGKRRAGLDPSHRAVLLFAGPGIASSGVIVWGPPSFTGVPEIVDEIVASISAAGDRT